MRIFRISIRPSCDRLWHQLQPAGSLVRRPLSDGRESPGCSPRHRPLRILQIGAVETGGGAASVAGNLMRGYRARGCEAWMAVGRQASDDPNVFMLPDDHRAAYRLTGYVALQKRLRRLAMRFSGKRMGVAQPVTSV